MAMSLVSTVTVGSGGATTVDFTNIPQTGKDLLILCSTRSSNASVAPDIYLLLNNDLSNSVSWRRLVGSGTSATSQNGSSTSYASMTFQTGANATSNTFANVQMYVANYAGNTAKSWSGDSVTENNATEAYQVLGAATLNQTAPVTSIVVVGAGNFVQHSTVSLYLIS